MIVCVEEISSTYARAHGTSLISRAAKLPKGPRRGGDRRARRRPVRCYFYSLSPGTAARTRSTTSLRDDCDDDETVCTRRKRARVRCQNAGELDLDADAVQSRSPSAGAQPPPHGLYVLYGRRWRLTRLLIGFLVG